MWVWCREYAHHNLGFGAVCFFGLGSFSSCVGLCGVEFFTQPYVGSMLIGVGVVVGVCCGPNFCNIGVLIASVRTNQPKK